MGTWGPGNFENDGAAEHLINLCNSMLTQIRGTAANPELMNPQDDQSDIMLANIEILTLLGQGIGRTRKGAIQDFLFPFRLPPAKEVRKWKGDYLKIWDREIDGLSPAPDYKRDRRKIILDTFDRLIAASKAGPPMRGNVE